MIRWTSGSFRARTGAVRDEQHTEAFLPGLGKLTAWRGRHQRGDMSEATLLAATGAAWALGIPLNLIGAGIEAFGPLEKTVAGAH